MSATDTIDLETATPAEIRRFLRPAPATRTVTRRSIDGTELGAVDLDPAVFGIEPNVAVLHQVVTAQLAARPLRHPVDQDPGRGPRRRRQALPPEGHRPGPPGLDPLARSRPAAASPSGRSPARYAPADPQEDDPAGPALRPLGPGRRGQGRRRRRAGPSRSRRPRTPSPPSPPSGCRGRVLVVLGAGRRLRRPLLRQPAGRPDHPGRRAQRLRHPEQRLDRLHRRHPAGRAPGDAADVPQPRPPPPSRRRRPPHRRPPHREADGARPTAPSRRRRRDRRRRRRRAEAADTGATTTPTPTGSAS